MNEIILRESGNTYVGELANKFSFHKFSLPKVTKLSPDERFHVFEVITDTGEVIHRAAQSTRELALTYMADNRVLVWRETESGEAAPFSCRNHVFNATSLVAYCDNIDGSRKAELHKQRVTNPMTREWLGDYGWEVWTEDDPDRVTRYASEEIARKAFRSAMVHGTNGFGNC